MQQIPTYKSNTKIDSTLFKRIAYNFVKQNGYVSGETISKLTDAWDSDYSFKATRESELDDMNKWVDNLTPTNDYFQNAVTAWNKSELEYKDLALVASFINSFFKAIKREAEIEYNRKHSKSQFVGDIGSKIRFIINDYKIVYEFGSYSYYDTSTTYLYRIVGQDNNIYMWATAKKLEVGKTVEATVKEYSEFKGEKQTTITRGKIL